MKIEARIIKRYCFRDHYAFLVMEAPGMREELLLYIQADNRDEVMFVRRLPGCTLDDTDRHLREIEALADQAVKQYEEGCGEAPDPPRSAGERHAAAGRFSGAAAGAAEPAGTGGDRKSVV